jgi:DegV family protein with EDD domain
VATDRAVAIVTDSTADLPAELAAANNIVVVPLNVTIEGRTYQATELSQADFFARMNAAKELPTTSQASVGTFAEVYSRALETARDVVSIHISSGLSGTIDSAYAAAEQFGGRVHVFDSLNLSWGLGFQALEAARSAATGASVADVLEHTERIRERVRMIVGLDKLDNLAKGGRIGAVSAFLGGLLNLKVTLTVTEEGVFAPVARTRGRTAALEHTIDWVRGHMGDAKSGAFCVMHAMSPDNAEWLRERLEKAFTATEMHVVEVGVVIATHTGTGWGVAVVPAE